MDIVGKLLSLPITDAKEKRERDKLVSRLVPLLKQADAFAARIAQARRSETQKAWDEIRPLCRKQLQLVTLRQDALNAEGRVQSGIENRQHDFTNLQAAQMAKLPAYPTDAEIASREVNIERARGILADAEKELSYAVGDRYKVKAQLEEAEKKMAELGSQELRLRHALDGRKYFDAETGLEVPR